jgi:hypothetical protein
MIKGKHIDYGFERTRNGPMVAARPNIGSALHAAVAKLLLGIVLTLNVQDDLRRPGVRLKSDLLTRFLRVATFVRPRTSDNRKSTIEHRFGRIPQRGNVGINAILSAKTRPYAGNPRWLS